MIKWPGSLMLSDVILPLSRSAAQARRQVRDDVGKNSLTFDLDLILLPVNHLIDP